MFQKGYEKLESDLDIVKLIHTNIENLMNRSVLFNSDERLLMAFSRRRIIMSDSNSDRENKMAMKYVNFH